MPAGRLSRRLALLAATAWSSAGVLAAAELQEAQGQFRAGDYDACIAAAAEELDAGRGFVEWRLLKIDAELALGRYEAAAATAAEALDDHPLSIPLRLRASDVFRRNGQAVRADNEVELIGRLAASDPRYHGSAESRVALGRYFLLRGADARQVLEIFYDPVVKAEPDGAETYFAIAELALEKFDDALAAQTLQQAPAALREDPRYGFLLARALRQDDPTAASQSLAAALAINPRHGPSLLLQAEQLIDAEQYADAAKAIGQVLKVNPQEPLAWALQAVLENLANRPDAQREARDRALASWPQNPAVDHTIGRKLSDHYRFAEGAEHQRQALALDANFLPARTQLAQDLLRLGEEDEGWRLADAVSQADGYNVAAHNLATLHDSLGRYVVLVNDDVRLRMEAREAAIYGPRALDLLSRAKRTLGAKYGVALDRPVAVDVYARKEDFAVRTFGLPGADGFLGVCFGNVITANSPAALGGVSANWESVLWHEFCHAVTLRKTRNKMPRWLSEGISVYEERQADPAWGEKLTPEYRRMIVAGEAPPVSKLSGAFLAPASPLALQFAYYQSSLAVEWLVAEHGQETLNAILDDLGAGLAVEEAFARQGCPLSRVDGQFAEFVRRRVDELTPGATWEEFAASRGADSAGIAAQLAERPQSFPTLLQLAAAYEREAKWEELVDVAEKLRELFPGYVGEGHAYARLATAQRELGNEGAERAALAAWIERDAEAIPAYRRLGELAAAAGEWELVADCAARWLAVNPLTPAPHEQLALACVQRKQTRAAIAATEPLLEFPATDAVDVHYRLAELRHAAGDDAAARRQVLEAIEEAPRFLAAHRLLLSLGPTAAPSAPSARPVPATIRPVAPPAPAEGTSPPASNSPPTSSPDAPDAAEKSP